MFTSENHCKANFENVYKVNFKVRFLANTPFYVIQDLLVSLFTMNLTENNLTLMEILMFKQVLKFALLIAMAAVIAGCQQQAASGPKVGFVNSNKVFKECKAGAEGMEYLQKAGEEFQSKFAEMQKNLAGNQTEENTRKFQEALNEYQTKMGAEQNRIIEALQGGFTKAVDDYRKANGYSAILSTESAISYDESADISDKIIEDMNKMAIKIKPE